MTHPHPTARSRFVASIVMGLALSAPMTSFSKSPDAPHKAISAPTESLAAYEHQAKRFKPANGLAATNSNDVRRFVYEWFTQFEHASPADYYLSHLDDKNMSMAFPGTAPLTSHAAFSTWYNNLLAQTLWNFHDVSALEIKPVADQKFLVSFIIDWYGEVKSDSPQRAGWQSRKDSFVYRHKLRQTWTVNTGERLTIEKLVVSDGNSASPIRD